MIKTDLLKELDSLGKLENNWDGYGAIKVLPECINNATKIINQLSCDKVSDIYANPNGTITIKWEDNLNNCIEVEVGKTNFSFYSDINNDLIMKDKVDLNLLKDYLKKIL